jgi:hypothetical protein
MVVLNQLFVFSVIVGGFNPEARLKTGAVYFGDVSNTLGAPSFSPYRPGFVPTGHPSFNAGKIARISSRVGRRTEWTCTRRVASPMVTLKLSFACFPINAWPKGEV